MMKKHRLGEAQLKNETWSAFVVHEKDVGSDEIPYLVISISLLRFKDQERWPNGLGADLELFIFESGDYYITENDGEDVVYENHFKIWDGPFDCDCYGECEVATHEA